MKRTFTLSTLLLCASLAGPANFAARAGAQTTPPAPRVVTLAGLRAPARVTRDDRGIPHIEAASDDDLYFAQGYATAQDRLWQMDLLRRTARGELSEIFGRVVLEEDKRHRTYGFARIAEQSEALGSAQTRTALEAYARGVNAYVESLDGTEGRQLPPEFRLLQYRPRPWRPADSIVISKNFAEALSTTYPVDLGRAALSDLPAERRAELLADSTPLDVLVVGTDEVKKDSRPARPAAPKPSQPARPAGDEQARIELLREAVRAIELSRLSLERVGLYMDDRAMSNNWVAAGKRTTTGRPLLANDPHLQASAPSVWHMVHLKAPGVDVAGVAAPGSPGVIIGHNERVAWGVTNLDPDVQDLYAEKFVAGRPTFYETPSGPREAEVRREEIKVRKSVTGAQADAETVEHTVTVTRHGPVVLERAGTRYALRWTALEPNASEFEAFYKLNRARNWDDFRAALAAYRGPTQNFVYADTAGHIGYYGAGVVPVRKSGDGSIPYDGSTDAGEWVGTIPFDELPHVFDPPSGLIITANSRVVGRSYPHFLTHYWSDPYRARRIHDLLSAKPKLTADDFAAVQGDIYSIGGANFAREAAGLLRGAGGTQGGADESHATETAAALGGWDGRVTPESRVAPLVAEMRGAFRRRVLSEALGAERAAQFRWGGYVFDRFAAERPAAWLPKEFKDYGALMRACLADARAALLKRLGEDESKWTWGAYQPARFSHPLASVPFVGAPFLVPPFPQGGSSGAAGATPNVGASVSMRLIADTSDWDRTRHGITLGESGDPASPYWSNQLADWRAVTPRAFPFTAPAVARAATEVWELRPQGR